jgi:hypothetical protein
MPNGSRSPDSWPGTTAWPARPTRWTCASSPPGAAPAPCTCSPSAAPTSKASPATWKHEDERATVTRRLCTIAGFYRYAVEEELLDHSPAAHVRRPRLDYESHATALDRNELGALLVAAGLGPPPEHALISLLALNGLRISEATGADIEQLALGLERAQRTLTITRKGGKVVTIPLAPRTARAIDLAVGERTEGPLFLAANGRRLDRHGAARIVHRVTRRRDGARLLLSRGCRLTSTHWLHWFLPRHSLYAVVVTPNVISTVSVSGKTATVVSDSTLLGWSCAGLLILSAGLYIAGRVKAKLTLWDIPRALIPPVAFTAWMLVQAPGVFDVWWHGSTTAQHVIIAAFAAVVLGVLAKALGYQADQAAAQPAAVPPAAVRSAA